MHTYYTMHYAYQKILLTDDSIIQRDEIKNKYGRNNTAYSGTVVYNKAMAADWTCAEKGIQGY